MSGLATDASVLSRQQTSVLSQQQTPVLSQQQTSVLSQQKTSILSQQQTCSLLQEQTSVVCQHTVLMSEKSQLSQCSSLRSLNCGNVTMFKSQIGGLALNRRKWSGMGLEWSPGPENRSPGFPRQFSRLWDRSRGPKPSKYNPNSRSTAPGGRYWYALRIW